MKTLADAIHPYNTTVPTQSTWASLISNGDMADANFELIEKAKQEIVLVEFLVRDDEFGLMKLALLRKKRREGVRIQIHVDAFHLLVNPALVKHLIDEGVEFTVFNELRLSRLNKVTVRNHCKILIVDGHWLKMGDANTGNEYVHWGDGHQMKSIDVIIKSPETDLMRRFARDLMTCDLSKVPEIEVAPEAQVSSQRAHVANLKQVAKTFFELLQIQMDAPDQFTRPQKVFITEEELRVAIATMDRAEESYEVRARTLSPTESHLGKERALTADEIRFHVDPVEKADASEGVSLAIRNFIQKGMTELTIVTPYLLLTDEMKSSLTAALSRGVRVRIYTNSMKSTDNRTTQLAYEYNLEDLSVLDPDGHLEIYEYQGHETIHAKFILRDQKDCMVMTYNLDWRSQILNLETAVEFSSRGLTEDLQNWLQKHHDSFELVVGSGQVLKSVPSETTTSDFLKRLVIQAIEKQL